MAERSLTFTGIYAGRYRETDKRFLEVKKTFLAERSANEFPEFVKRATVDAWDREHGGIIEPSVPLQEILQRIATLEDLIRRSVRSETPSSPQPIINKDQEEQIDALQKLADLANTNLGMK